MSTIPSIAMIPSAYKASKLYSVLPLDGSGDLDVVRASSATRINKDGIIEEVANNVPRLDYSDGTCPSLLLEPQSTNLITHSEDFSDSSWGKSSVVDIQGSSIPSIFKDKLADKLVFNSNNTNKNHLISYTINNNSSDFTFTIYLKKSELNYIHTRFITLGGTSVNNGLCIDLESNSLIQGKYDGSLVLATLDGVLKELTDNWVEVNINVPSPDSSTNVLIYMSDSKDTTEVINKDNQGFYLAGCQSEALPYATSYIPTNGAIATRLLDQVSKTGIASLINSQEGVLYVEIKGFVGVGGGTRRIILGNDVSTPNKYIRLQIASGTGNLFVIINNGSQQYLFEDTSFSPTIHNKIAVKYKENDFALWINGIELDSQSSGSTFSTNELDSVSFSSLSNNFYGKCESLRVYNTILTDEELQALTS